MVHIYLHYAPRNPTRDADTGTKHDPANGQFTSGSEREARKKRRQSGYNEQGVNRAIRQHNRRGRGGIISGKEARLVRALLKGRG
jgi:hypothetical protein